ncbi:MAG: helicase-related protein, partial [Sphaerochaeta sp.]
WIAQGVDVYVATPGRILDYQKMQKIDFRQFDIFVVDEADRLFDMGFYPDIQKMFSLLREAKTRQTMLFSATLSTKVRQIAWQYMNEPKEIEVQPEEITVKEITQEIYHISKAEKFGLFLQLLREANPASCLVFTNTKARCIEVSKRLSMNGYPSKYLMGDLPQSKRLEVIGRMKSGKLRFLVATDVAARGLQIDDLEMVVNYDIPEDYESYVHRIGRTARAGKSGKSITLADEEYVLNLEAIEEYIQMKIPVIWPENLPEVEDKSKSYSFRDLVGERGYASKAPRRGRRTAPKGPRPASKRTTQRPRTQKPQTQRPRPSSGPKQQAPRRSAKAYADLSALPLEERLAYYKKEYLGEEKGTSAPKKTPAAPLKSEEPKKKEGFFARLFSKRGQ